MLIESHKEKIKSDNKYYSLKKNSQLKKKVVVKMKEFIYDMKN